MESQARGGTRWRRFGLVMVPSVAATAAIGIALAQGALAASFAVSGQQFKVKAGELTGWDMIQYGSYVNPAGGDREPVTVSAFERAEIVDLCQSVVVPGIPLLGDVTLRIEAGSNPNNPVEAENLFIDISQLDASNAVFTNIDIGVSVDAEDKAPDPQGPYRPGSFSQLSDKAELRDIEQTAWATSAGTFTLTDFSMGLHLNGGECF